MRFLRSKIHLKLSDAELVSRFEEGGSLETLGHLYDRYLEYVYGICLKYLRNEEASKDAVMTIFESLAKKMSKHKVENFKGWIYVVAKNHCLEHIRKNKKNLTAPMTDLLMHSNEIMHHDDEFEIIKEHAALYDCVHKLSLEQKKCIELFYFEGYSYEEVASELEVEKDKVRSYIQNGRRNLKNCLQIKEHNGSV